MTNPIDSIAEIVFEDMKLMRARRSHPDEGAAAVTDTIAKQARWLAALFRVAREVTLAPPQADEHALIEPHMHEVIAQALDEHADRQESRLLLFEKTSKDRAGRLTSLVDALRAYVPQADDDIGDEIEQAADELVDMLPSHGYD
jgi:hypothetical protein